MSEEQREEIEGQLRDGPLDMGGELADQRQVMEEMIDSFPVADDVETEAAKLGSIDALLVETAESRAGRTILYLHGGAYSLGSAKGGVPLASEVARRCNARAGSHEILAGDALELARRAVEAEVRVDLQVWPGVPHVFQGFASQLDEGAEALDALGRFLDLRLALSDAA